MKLKDRVAIVTGATSGIGEASALLFAAEGARVTVTGRDDARGAKGGRRDRGGRGHGDLRPGRRPAFRPTASASWRRRCASFGGRLDILFNNAGVFHPHNSIDCTEEEWDATVDSSLKGAWLMAKYSLPTMIAQGRGVIINQASGWGIQGGDDAVAYCAAKGGLVVMTKAMAIDHGKQGIRVNCLCPGDVDTPMLAADAEARRLSYADYMKGASNRPLGRVGTTSELAQAALFLASDDSSFMTGAALVVDGGGIAG